jgi:hypothetical protein
VIVPTVERGLRFVDFWSIDTAGSALDEVDVGAIHLTEELARVRAQRLDVAPLASAKIVSNARDDLPDPERPVKTTSESRGMSRSTFLRLWTRAPRTLSFEAATGR